MKQIFTPIILALLLFTACNNTPAKTDEAKPADTPTATKAVPDNHSFLRLIELTLTDYNKWYTIFHSNDSLRKTRGLINPYVGQLQSDKNKVLVFLDVVDVARSKAYDASDERKANLKTGGVTNSGEPEYWNVLMDDTTTIPQKERAMLTFHVKDFTAWKKAFVAEGTDKRKASGYYERLLAQKENDPNTICILIAVLDNKKGNPLTTPEFKKSFTDAGVEGDPQITYFKWVNY